VTGRPAGGWRLARKISWDEKELFVRPAYQQPREALWPAARNGVSHFDQLIFRSMPLAHRRRVVAAPASSRNAERLDAQSQSRCAVKAEALSFFDGARQRCVNFFCVPPAIFVEPSHVHTRILEYRVDLRVFVDTVRTPIKASWATRYLPCHWAASAERAAYSETSPNTGHSLFVSMLIDVKMTRRRAQIFHAWTLGAG